MSVPSFAEQTMLFDKLFAEAAQVENPAKAGRGPFANNFQTIEQQAIKGFNEACGLTGDNPYRLQPDALQSSTFYRSQATGELLKQLANNGVAVDDKREAVNTVRRAHTGSLVREIIAPALKKQFLEPGLLSTPPYCRQTLQRGCALATFCMVFGGITGITPTETLLRKSLKTTA